MLGDYWVLRQYLCDASGWKRVLGGYVKGGS